MSFWRLSSKKEPVKKEVDNENTCVYGLPCVLNIDYVIKIYNSTCNKGLSHYFSIKAVDFRQGNNLKDKKFVVE